MSLQIISSSPAIDAAIISVDNTLFVEASSDQLPLSYQWYGGTTGDVPLVGETESTYSVPDSDNLAGKFKVKITDSLNRSVEREFQYNGLTMWKDGVNPKTQVVTIDSLPVATTNRIRGSVHNYNNIYELSYANSNFQRIIYGQIAFVQYDIPAISPLTGQVQHQTPISKFYKCNVREPYVRDEVFKTVTIEQWREGRLNAKYWVSAGNGTGSGASARPIMNSDRYVIGIELLAQGEWYEPDTTVIGVSTNEDVQLKDLNPQVVDVDWGGVQGIIQISTAGIIGPFAVPPVIVIISGRYTTPDYPPQPIFQWTVGNSNAYDWQEVTFLNAEPDNDTIIVEDGLVKANIPKPYSPVTLSLTAQNAGFVNTDLLNEVSTTVAIKNIHVYADNFVNICANTLGASSITLSAITSDGTQSIITALGAIPTSSLSQGFGNLSVTIDKTGLNQNHTVTIIAAATEVGADNARTHVVTASTQIQWCYNKYYLKDSNSTVSNTITIPNSAGRELSFVPQGSYDFPYTATPQYLWILLPTHMSVNHIGTADQSVPFYSDAGNNLITTNITIVRNDQSQSYKGYRSYWPTAADYTVTI